MIPEYFAIIGSIIASFGGAYYLYCTVRGTVQPNRVTWFFWGVFPMIVFFAQLSEGVGLIAWATFVSGLYPFLIIAASYFNPKAYWQLKKIDYVYAMIAVIGIILWQITDNGNLAIVLALLADFAVTLPTISKSLADPESESPVAYGISTVGFFVAILAVQSWTFAGSATVMYLFATQLLLTVLTLRKRTKVNVI